LLDLWGFLGRRLALWPLAWFPFWLDLRRRLENRLRRRLGLFAFGYLRPIDCAGPAAILTRFGRSGRSGRVVDWRRRGLDANGCSIAEYACPAQLLIKRLFRFSLGCSNASRPLPGNDRRSLGLDLTRDPRLDLLDRWQKNSCRGVWILR
jgi:hypothetical protein